MSDLIRCAKCGKQTNKYSPVCEHCSQPIEHTVLKTRHSPEAEEGRPGDSASQTIEERGKAVHAELEKYSGQLKKCPFCAEEIQAEAIKCRYCGERIKRPAKSRMRYFVIVLALAAVIAATAVAALLFTGIGDRLRGSARIKYDTALSPELKSDPVKANYVKKYITVTDFGTLDETDPKSSAVTKYFCGTINNAGDRTVIKLTLTVYYFDKNGTCIAEGTIAPIHGTKDKPNSVKPAGSKEFTVPVMNANPEWSGRVREKVSDIEFI